jgi:hypothetical protein
MIHAEQAAEIHDQISSGLEQGAADLHEAFAPSRIALGLGVGSGRVAIPARLELQLPHFWLE